MRNCLVCGTELKADWTACESCQTPVPDYEKPVLESVQTTGPTDTSRKALWSAALVGLGMCVPFAPIAAVPVGLSAIRDINDSGDRLAGRGFAMFGLIAGGLFGAVQLFVLAALLVPMVLGGPALLAAFAGGGEDMGLEGLKQLYKAESMARFSVVVDTDQDGLGEFCTIERLGEGHIPFLRKDFADGAVGGYWLQVVLPEGADQRERTWWGIAQPQSARHGWRTFVVDGKGVIHAKNTRGEAPDLTDLQSWTAIDMVITQYDEEVQAAQAEIQARQHDQRLRQHYDMAGEFVHPPIRSPH